MTGSDYKKYTTQAKAAIKGEAFFEALVSDYSIPHHVVGLKDVGIDYICEWVFGDKPTGVLFAVQVKTLSARYAKPESLGINKGHNELNSFKITNHHLDIDEKTLKYWRGLGMPVYLFAIIYPALEGHGEQLNCYYKRFTRVLTTNKTQEEECFYQVNRDTNFLAFVDPVSNRFGFARDLYIDLMRCLYYKGSISYISPRTLGLEQFPESDVVINDLFKEYEDNIYKTIEQTEELIEQVKNNRAIPSAEIPEEE